VFKEVHLATGLSMKWEGFTASERGKLQTLWSQLSFRAEICQEFSGEGQKGAPGEHGLFHMKAKDLRVHREHCTASFEFSSLEKLIDLFPEVVA
jgi:hypothetical protein